MQSQPVIRATLRAIGSAQDAYERMSGTWLQDGAEYFATTYIAQAVFNIPAVRSVTLEHNVSDAIRRAGGDMRGPPSKDINRNGKFDLTVSNTVGPRGLIEVKTRIYYRYITQDVRELCRALRRGKDLRWGLLAYYTSKKLGDGTPHDARKRVRRQTEEVMRRAGLAVTSDCTVERHTSPVHANSGGAWTAEVLEIRRAA